MAFDFGISMDGDIVKDSTTMDIKRKEDYPLKVQLAYNRLKSISKDWFIDECGADLEELIGKPCTPDIASYGEEKINSMLILDDLWQSDEFYIYSQIRNDVTIEYSVYLKICDGDIESGGNVESYEINITLDLVKGVKIRYGWNPRRTDLW